MSTKGEHGPIFIGGPDRCGKTLLRALLVSHPDIAIPQIGSNYWTFFYGQYGNLRSPENLERCLAAMLRYTHVQLLNPDVEAIRAEFWRGEPSYGRLFMLFNQQYAERQGKQRWGDQSGFIERYAEQIFCAYPDAKMIHMLRDPRDRYQASLLHAPNGKGRVGAAAARWLYSVHLARRNSKRFPHRYKVVHYETLVRQPAETLGEICEFLGTEYSPELLTMNGAPGFQEESRQGNQRGDSLISTEFIGRYRGTIAPAEIAFMQSVIGREMLHHDYPLESISLTARERMKYVMVCWPSNFGRMVAWMGREAIQHRLPAHFGRKPPADKIR